MPGEHLPRRVWNRQTKFTYNHWLAALVNWKCSSTKPTRLATGVVCHPDTEQNRPYKIPGPYRELNRGPTAPQARTLPVCHTKRKTYFQNFIWFHFHVYKLCMITCVSAFHTVLNYWRRRYVKFALRSHDLWCQFNSVGEICFFRDELYKLIQKIANFWNLESALYMKSMSMPLRL